MNARPLLTATLLVVSVAVVVAVDKCEPDCFGHNAGDMVSDPMDCTQYYLCLADGTATDDPLSCGSGFHFDPEIPACVLGGDCDTICTPYVCHMSCDYAGDLIADPKDCNKYYVCNAALAIGETFLCPIDRPYFGGEYCITDDSHCCQPQCEPYCGPGNVQIIDPKDCTKYYICLVEGPPDEANHHSCPTGETFDVVSSTCAVNQPCVTLCDDIDPLPDCDSSYTCTGSGFYPLSQTCEAEYYNCSAKGECGEIESCSSGMVFNPVLGYPMCLQPSHCPYNPSMQWSWDAALRHASTTSFSSRRSGTTMILAASPTHLSAGFLLPYPPR